MKTLLQSLIDYDIALLRAIADCRGVPITTANKREVTAILVDALLSPAALAIILNDLPPEEKAAFQFLVEHQGQIEGPRFTRQFGVIRQMGAARLEREQPWHKPANPAEGLWYKGLIFKAFQMALHGNVEVVYIPTDLLPLLQVIQTDPTTAEQTTQTSQAKIFQFRQKQEDNLLPLENERGKSGKKGSQFPYLTLTQPPPLVIAGEGRLRESMFTLLVYLQTHAVRLTKEEQLNPKDNQALATLLAPPLLPDLTKTAELDFLIHLGRRTDLLTVRHGRIKPEREAVRTWLQAPPLKQTQFLQNAWRADPTWNDLWRIPSLAPQPTGWENSPLLARSKILGYLAREETLSGAWLALDSFITAIKLFDPDFQRPHGDYHSWYIYDLNNHPLLGFEYWEQIEGALIRYIITHILLLLGVVDVGLSPKIALPTSFQITPQGEGFLINRLPVATPSKKSLFLRVGPNFHVYVPHQASLYDRFQLARFAELTQREENRVVYQITQASVGQALRNGVTADQMVAFLARVTNNQTPLKVVETLRTWGMRQGTAYLERATLLRLKHESQVEEIAKNPTLKPLLGEIIGPKAILVPSENTLEVRRILLELGYLNAGD